MTGCLELTNVSVSFDAVEVIRDLSLGILRGEFVAIVGPSGCGKTTLLNLVAGFERPSLGSVECHGQVRMVYQVDGLFPWATVTENIALGLRDIGDWRERKHQIGDLLRLIRIEGFAHHYPRQLSGGMRQLVELARALAGGSDVLLMDEPFSALDYLTRLRMRNELARLLREMPRTAVLVTHDIEEAAQLADRVVVLTQRPARIRREFTISTPRPREPTDPAVVDAVRRILAELDVESGAAASTK
jgi:ABC-type nitrate/sulfonate/bicarbonate transport system ATPase subunit